MERIERRAKEKRWKSFCRAISYSAVGALGFLLIAFFVFFFDGGENTENAVQDEVQEEFLREIVGIEEAVFYGVRGNRVEGYMRRTVENGEFKAGSVVELPSQDDNSYYYEAWFVRPGVTDYFSAGAYERRADGLYGLRFQSVIEELPAEYAEYSKVIITREPRNGDQFPSPAHIGEAYF